MSMRALFIRTAQLVVALLVILSAACGPRQWVVIIDTDAPVPGMLATHPELSPAAAIDVVRVDVLGQDGELLDVCELVAPEAANWPLSLGVAASDAPPVLMRVRAFRRLYARSVISTGHHRLCGQDIPPGQVLSLNEPPPELTIDRVVELPHDVVSTQHIQITLSLDCIGAVPSFLDRTTCIDRRRYAGWSAPFASAFNQRIVDKSAVMHSAVGTSWLARETDCRRPMPAGLDPAEVICIKGGFSFIGAPRWAQMIDPANNPTPAFPVYLSPFYLDKFEFSVGRFEQLRQKGIPLELPEPNGSPRQMFSQHCTWQPGADPRLPLNCLSWVAASQACRASAGELPTEAQWEHAARGRGRGWSYPWGNQKRTQCCKASWERTWEQVPNIGCPGGTPDRVGAHDGQGCADGGDVSLDGINDLAGNLIEFVRDGFRPYTERCGRSAGVSIDPICVTPPGNAAVLRGLGWVSSADVEASIFRSHGVVGVWTGFRCAYPGG